MALVIPNPTYLGILVLVRPKAKHSMPFGYPTFYTPENRCPGQSEPQVSWEDTPFPIWKSLTKHQKSCDNDKHLSRVWHCETLSFSTMKSPVLPKPASGAPLEFRPEPGQHPKAPLGLICMTFCLTHGSSPHLNRSFSSLLSGDAQARQ